MAENLTETFTFWYQKFQKTQATDFKNTLYPIASVSTATQFWDYYQHIQRPNKLQDGSYLYLFRKGIKPIWEDKANKNGGAFVILAEKQKANRMWENVLLSFVTAAEEAKLINGIRLKIKKDVAHIDVWTTDLSGDEDTEDDLRNWVLEVAGLKEDTNIEYLPFNTEA